MPPIPTSLENGFDRFRRNIIGIDQEIETHHGPAKLLYADWTAAGRAYRPIETALLEEVLPFFANTHTETTFTAKATTKAYETARSIVRVHVNASADDALVFCGSGMTAAVNKLQRIMGLRLPEWAGSHIPLQPRQRPLVLLTHMEHHSNHISWLETIATVELIRPGEDGNVDLDHLRHLLSRYASRRLKIAAVTACSNVSGIETPYHAIAAIMHAHGGYCFVDFASSAPYVRIDMHPGDSQRHLDAIYFSCHKFLGGPGTPGVLIFNKLLYHNRIPDQPGGGVMLYTNPWKQRDYIDDIELREDGGTPPILQGIKAGMCIRLKEAMGIDNIRAREAQLVDRLFQGFAKIPQVRLLAPANTRRLAIFSLVHPDMHYNSIVRDLNDNYGIQTRGGCSCAGTYGHYLLGIDAARSQAIRQKLLAGDLRSKPGWVRVSVHPTTTDAEIDYLVDALASTVRAPRIPGQPVHACTFR